MKISVIIPLYNGENFISETIYSIFSSWRFLNSEFSVKLEIILVDDASKDGTVKIIKELFKSDREIRNVCSIIKHETNLGVVQSRLDGLKKCTGDYIYIIDQDDIVHKNFFRNMIKICTDRKIPVSNYNVIDEKNHILRKGVDIKFNKKLNNPLTYIYGGNILPTPGIVFFNSDAHKAIIEYYEMIIDQKVDGTDDGFLYYYLIRRGFKFSFVQDVGFSYRLHSSNQRKLIGRIKMYEKAKKLISVLYENNILPKNHYTSAIKRLNFNIEYFAKKNAIDKMIIIFKYFDVILRKIWWKYV